MAFIGDIFHAIGSLFGGGGGGSQPQAPQITLPKQTAPQTQAQDKPSGTTNANPSFLAAAALPNYGQSQGTAGATSNAGGKSLLGQ